MVLNFRRLAFSLYLCRSHLTTQLTLHPAAMVQQALLVA
jgi:hypothetical protein